MKKKIIIKGEKVHGVGYRPFLLAKARKVGITKFEAENVEEDGLQKVIVCVDGEDGQINKFVGCIKNNYPPQAKVSEVKEEETSEDVMNIGDYQKILDTEQHNTMIQAGMGMIDMQKKTVGLQKETLGLQKETLGLQKETIESIDQGFARMDRNFTSLKQDYGKIYQTMEKILKQMSEQQKESTDAINELTKAILKLAEKKS